MWYMYSKGVKTWILREGCLSCENAAGDRFDWTSLDRCHTCDFIARQSCSTQLCMSHTATLWHKQKMTN